MDVTDFEDLAVFFFEILPNIFQSFNEISQCAGIFGPSCYLMADLNNLDIKFKIVQM